MAKRCVVACLMLAVSLAQAAAGEEVFRRAGQAPFKMGEALRVEQGPLQVELAPGLVLSAGTGAEFQVVSKPGGAAALRVGTGPVLLVDLSRNTVVELPPGSYDGGASYAMVTDPFVRQDFRFGDYVLVRQKEYLNSIGMDVTPINNVISSFLLGLFRR